MYILYIGSSLTLTAGSRSMRVVNENSVELQGEKSTTRDRRETYFSKIVLLRNVSAARVLQRSQKLSTKPYETPSVRAR